MTNRQTPYKFSYMEMYFIKTLANIFLSGWRTLSCQDRIYTSTTFTVDYLYKKEFLAGVYFFNQSLLDLFISWICRGQDQQHKISSLPPPTTLNGRVPDIWSYPIIQHFLDKNFVANITVQTRILQFRMYNWILKGFSTALLFSIWILVWRKPNYLTFNLKSHTSSPQKNN